MMRHGAWRGDGVSTSRQGKSDRLLNFETLETRAMLSADPLSGITAQVGVSPMASGGGPIGYTPAQIASAYGFNNITFGTLKGTGAGQTIAIVDAYDDPNIASDLATFDAQFGLPAANFTKIEQLVGGVAPAEDAGWATEISLDVEWAHAMAPGANIELIEANNSSLSDLLASVQYAASQTGVSVVSMSWGTSEFNGETNYNSYFTTPSGHNGVSFVASSGDSGAGALWPAISPNVLSVGGTTLNLSGSTYSSETAWSGSGGGKSVYQGESSYQQGVQTSGAAEDPDVAYDANPNTGFAVYDSIPDEGYVGWEEVGGTSAGSPQWSALVAIADQGRAAKSENTLTSAAAAVYALPSSDFHDVTSGSNGGYSAGKGYDEVTGLGSPLANLVAQGLVGITTAQQTFTTSTLTTTSHRGFVRSGGQQRFDDVAGDSTSFLMTGVAFQGAAGNTATSGSGSIAGVGSQVFTATAESAGQLSANWLASGTIQQAAAGLEHTGNSTSDGDAVSGDGSVDETPRSLGGSLASRNEAAERRASESLHASNLTGQLASPSAIDVETRSLVESLDSLFDSPHDWTVLPDRFEAGAWASESAALQSIADRTSSQPADRPSVAMLAVGLALSALWRESERAEDQRRQARAVHRRDKGSAAD